MKSINYKAPHYAVFSISIISSFLGSNISSKPCSQAPSMCVLPLGWQTILKKKKSPFMGVRVGKQYKDLPTLKPTLPSYEEHCCQ
jgi:hypothetical protein